jgi:carbon monoxide dehydrogenase subunit G
MKIEEHVEVGSAADRVWEFLEDIPRVAGCLPGASLTAVVDDDTYEGMVAVKIGPIAMNYQGTLVVEERNAGERSVRMTARAKDRKGAGAAKGTIVARLSETAPDTTTISVISDLQLTGRVASLGRGVQDVTSQLFAEFADRMRAELAPAQSVTPRAVPAVAGTAEHDASPRSSSPAASGAVTDRVVAASAASRAEEIKVGRLLWLVLRDKISALFSRLRKGR